MNRRKATLGVAGVGVVAGVAGLVVLASPAGAGQAPTLPATTPQALVQSVLTTRAPAMAGTVEIQSNLGLAAVPGIPQLANGTSQLRVWSDGNGRNRLSIPSGDSEETYVDDGTTLYQWDSASKTVREETEGTGRKATDHTKPKAAPKDMDPATAAKELVAAVQNYSTVSVQGTDTVAGRPAYDLVLTPKPSEHTLLREVRIAIDATQHLPLQLTVLGNNTSTPAVQIGFSSIDFGAQPASLFTFTPPPGSTVVKDKGDDGTKSDHDVQAIKPKLIGSGWDTVIIATLPTITGSGQADKSGASSAPAVPGMVGPAGGSSASGDGSGMNPMSIVRKIGTPVSGPWGSGWAISTDVATAIVTSDGRIAAGLVPEQVLTQVLGSTR